MAVKLKLHLLEELEQFIMKMIFRDKELCNKFVKQRKDRPEWKPKRQED